jgi:hypothetical protein
MWTLLDVARDYNLAVTARTPGSIHASSPASRQSDDNRFEMAILDWDGQVEKMWHGSSPSMLLEAALAYSHIRDLNGVTKLRLTDRYGGESVDMTNSSEQESSSLVALMNMKQDLNDTQEKGIAEMFDY